MYQVKFQRETCTTEHFHKTQTIELRVIIFHLHMTDINLAAWLEFRVILRCLETASPNFSKFLICNTVNLHLFEFPLFGNIYMNNHLTVWSLANWWTGPKSGQLAWPRRSVGLRSSVSHLKLFYHQENLSACYTFMFWSMLRCLHLLHALGPQWATLILMSQALRVSGPLHLFICWFYFCFQW